MENESVMSSTLEQLWPWFILLGVLSAVSSLIPKGKKKRRAARSGKNKSASQGRSMRKRAEASDLSDVDWERIERPTVLTTETLKWIEWKRFETFCTAFLRELDFVAKETRLGADGGIDILVSRPGEDRVCCIAQCKAWQNKPVGVKEIRELFGVMNADGISHGIFFASGSFTEAAKEFAAYKPIELFDGEKLVASIEKLSGDVRKPLVEDTFRGDYHTPTCPSCGVKMVKREGRKGASAGSAFWGCRNFPRCRCHFPYR